MSCRHQWSECKKSGHQTPKVDNKASTLHWCQQKSVGIAGRGNNKLSFTRRNGIAVANSQWQWDSACLWLVVIELDSDRDNHRETTKMRFILTASFTACSWPVFSHSGLLHTFCLLILALLKHNGKLKELGRGQTATVQIGQCTAAG